MCCEDLRSKFPSTVYDMLDGYRALAAKRTWDWGNDWTLMPFYAVQMIPCTVPVPLSRAINGRSEILDAAMGRMTPAEAMFRIVDGAPPAGTSLIDLSTGSVEVSSGPPPYVLVGQSFVHVVLVRGSARATRISAGTREETLEAGAYTLLLAPGAADGSTIVTIDGAPLRIGDAGEIVGSATLDIEVAECTRFMVLDDRRGGWFPSTYPEKWDTQYRPYFHARQARVTVPAAPLTVGATRGLEWEISTVAVSPRAGEAVPVGIVPNRLFAPSDGGWYSADLHVHMNYSGDLVATPEEAARMQLGEGLNVMNLVAGNAFTTRVYDREAFEATVGHDLPWADHSHVARFGVEFRNDLLGHFHALGPDKEPSRYQTGHAPEEGQEDWPANAAMAAEFRAADATTGYCHPLWWDIGDDGDFEHIFGGSWRGPRSVEARELVADAALGLMDTVDVLSPGNNHGSAHLYHRLLGSGLRLAVSAGTDVFLSFSHGLAADPPGWSRMYCRLDRELSIESIKDAIRNGSTIATNGPWIELKVEQRGPGSEVGVTTGARIAISARTEGNGVRRLDLIGPDGVISSAEGPTSSSIELDVVVTVHKSAWVAAVAYGDAHPAVNQGTAFAHTSPVYVVADGAPIARSEDADWCLRWLARLARLVTDHGRFHDPNHRRDVLDVLERAAAYYEGVVRKATPGPFLTLS